MDRQKHDLFHNLVQLAAIDGKFTEDEIEFLVRRAEQWGIPNDEFETALASLDEVDVHLKIPETKADRLEMLRQMIQLMAVDGELAEPEKRLCAAASASMEITSEEFIALINAMLSESS